jgi:HK97 family phage portal protein
MSIIDKWADRLGFQRKATYPARDPREWPSVWAAGEQYNIPDPAVYGNQADFYRTTSWIATAINRLAQAASVVPFSVKELTGEDIRDIPNHEFEVSLRKPNPMQSRSEFLEAWFSYYLLTGNGYLWLNRPNSTGKPLEMWVVPSNQIKVEPDGNLFVKHYEYNSNSGQTLYIPPTDIVHLKRFNPGNMFVGLSLIESIAEQATADLSRVRNDRKVQTNNGQPPSILAFADNYSETEWSRMKEDIKLAAEMRKFMMLRNTKAGGMQWIQNQLTAEDMQYIQSREFTRDEIFGLIAPGLASMLVTNATEANAKAGKATFIEFGVWPMLNAGAEKLTSDVLTYYGENLTGEFDDIRVKDRVLEMAEMVEYGKTHTLSEIRKKYYQDEPLGDDRDNLLPAQITPQSGQPAPMAETVPASVPMAEAETEAQPAQEVEPDEDDTQEAETESAVETEAAKWGRKAVKWLERGKSLEGMPFETDVIPLARCDAIRAGLAACKTAEDVRRVVSAPAQVVPVMVQRDNPAILALVEEIREARKAIAMEPQKMAITVNVPERGVTVNPQGITVNVPEQAAPVVSVKAGDITLPAPVVTINQQPATNKRIVQNADGSYEVTNG